MQGMETKGEEVAAEPSSEDVARVMRALRARRSHESNVAGGKARWKGTNKKERSAIMSEVAKARRKGEGKANG
jgi:hypothetical protein